MGEPFIHSLRVRYHECDAQGVVFNANHFTYADVTLTELWRAAFGSYTAFQESGNDVVVAEAAATFRAPVRFEDELEMWFLIERLGRTSMVSSFEERRDGEVLVSGRLVHVFVNPETLAKQEISSSVRERLAPWTAPGS